MQTLSVGRTGVFKPQKEVAIKTSATLITVAESNAELETVEREQTVATKSDSIDKQESDKTVSENKDKEEDPVQADAKTGDSEPADARQACLAVVHESQTTDKSASADAANQEHNIKLQQQAADEADPPAPARAQSCVAMCSPTPSQQASSQSEQENLLTMAADRVFCEEQPDADGRSMAARMLPSPQGALLLVTLGKPLSRLAGGDGRVDIVNTNCGSPAARTALDRSRRNRRKAAEAQDRWQRRGDVKESSWYPPEDLVCEIPPQSLESAQEPADDSRPAAEPLAPRLADLAIDSHLAVYDRKDSAGSSGPRPPALPVLADWDGYAVLGTASAAVLSTTISVLAADRYRRIHAQAHRIKLPRPIYTGRTLARV